jgi:hypothetical protein
MKLMATMTEDELREAMAVIRKESGPLYARLETFSDEDLVGRSRTYTPSQDVRVIHAQLKPLESQIACLQTELNDRERQRLNSESWEKKAKAIAAAPVHQKRNGWEIVKPDPTMPVYIVRDPLSKEEVYTGCLRRCRAVADESKPELDLISWVKQILSNDEDSTDDELRQLFIANNVPNPDAWLARRTEALSSPFGL